MSTPSYLATYQSAFRRYVEGCKDDQFEEWLEELGKIKADWKWSVSGMLTHCETNDAEIWHTLGDAFQNGRGIERDVGLAEQYYRMAAESRHVNSMIRLGLLLQRDGRSPEDLAESLQWFRRAADLGDSSGMTWLGYSYREGAGVAADPRQSVEWFIKAHAAGSKSAADQVGRALCSSRENHHESVKWFRIAVEQGNELSNYNLALIYEDRESPEYNAEEAFRCWSLVAERPRGDLRLMAMLRLARCCRDGNGTEQDRLKAIEWLELLLTLAPKKVYCREAAKLRQEIDEELF